VMDKERLEYARTVNLPAFLESELGLMPAGARGDERFYLSPLRRENTPSLHVSRKDGIWVWFDHGSAERSGGDAIELLRRMGYSFREAVEKLTAFNGSCVTGKASRGRSMKTSPAPAHGTGKDTVLIEKMDRVFYARDLYASLPAPGRVVERYFFDRGLAYYPEIGTKLFVDFKNSVKYVAFPVPFPSAMRGMELRELVPVSHEISPGFRKKRKCYGLKSLWVFRRNDKRILIAESILDALAGEVLFGFRDATLVALNGVGQAREVDVMLRHTRLEPMEVLVVVDNDGPGREAAEIIRSILAARRIKASFPIMSEKDPLRELFRKNHNLTRCK